MTGIVTVTVAQGALAGREETSKCQKTYYSFRGIPYAKPPVGPLRFKAPQPPEAWEGVRDASAEGAVSPHVQLILKEGYIGDEDCLFLNVYTPQLPSGADDPMKAVMVFIHGGGFSTGSGTAEFYGPDFLLNEDVVVVTLNYRLGALGFLSTGDAVIPGNNGLKDQVMALRWVQQNIAQFGGDPGNVTIFGESAGGASVHYQLLSPMSEGLFSRAIAQSGCALNPWAFHTPSEARRRAFRFGEVLGCKTNESKELAEFLSTVPAQQLVEIVSKAMSEEERDLGTVFFRPTVEVENREQEVFLPADPIDLITQGKFYKVPFLAGVNSNEGLLSLREVSAKPAILKKYDSDFELLIPANLGVEKNTPKSKEVAQKIKSFYFGDKPVSQDTLFQYVDFSGDMWFVADILRAAKLHAALSPTPVYLYQFSFDGELGFMKRIIGACRFPGVCHADELGYLIFSPHLDVELEGTPEETVRSQLVRMWTNFAKTGNPSLPGVKWEPMTESNPSYLNIDTEFTMQQHLMKDRMAFWEDLRQSVKQ